MIKFIWVTLILIASVFIFRIAGNKSEKMVRSTDRSIKRENVQQVNNTNDRSALKIDETYTSLALILGGMPFNTAGNQAVMNIFNEQATKRHITNIEKMWKTLEGNRLKKMGVLADGMLIWQMCAMLCGCFHSRETLAPKMYKNT